MEEPERAGPESSPRPEHHGPGGRFRNPWPLGREAPLGQGDFLRWMWERLRGGRAPNPSPDELPRATPDPATPRLPSDSNEVRITWVGHATFLVQFPGLNLLTDPMFSRRASPFQWMGPARLSPPGMTVDDLPPIDLVLLSHDHYDHLDGPSVRALHERFGDALLWLTPLGYDAWFGKREVPRVRCLDWWEEVGIEPGGDGPSGDGSAGDGSADATVRVRALPARHWTRRRLFDARKRLWCSWSVEAGGRKVYFGGDSGYCPGFAEIGQREGPFDVALLPIGAYEPRWFMRPSHMNPEEAAQACVDVDAPTMVGMHWGTFRLTDEPPFEPARRARRAWTDLGRAASDLYIPAHGETLRL